MEKPNFENGGQENLEKTKEELRVCWNELFDNLIQNKFNVETKEKIKTAEFNRLMEIYQEQDRPLKSYVNLNKALSENKDDLKKLALFYQDAYYDREGTVKKNKEGSLKLAQDFINLLSPGQQERFNAIF